MKRKVTRRMRWRWRVYRTLSKPTIRSALAELVRKNEELLYRMKAPKEKK